jgi:NAD(P)-dependent dehydrogenase (short-subunit alcohol dehydrogenase family)
VAIVTGASRGVGKGIAIALGAAGATVVVTGRTVSNDGHRLGGTIGETARLVDKAGGQGMACRVDHSKDAEVRRLVDDVVRKFGRVDILVNNAFSLPEPEDPARQLDKFWRLPLEFWDQMHTVGLRSHFVTSHAVAPLMVARRRGLIVNISSVGARMRIFNVPYCVGKSGVDRLAQTMAEDLHEFNVAAVSLWPGVVRTERILDMIASASDARDDFSSSATARAISQLLADRKIVARLIQSPELVARVTARLIGRPKLILSLLQSAELPAEAIGHLLSDEKIVESLTESPELTGHAIVNLAADPLIMKKSGRALVVAELAREYGFSEDNGRLPPLLISGQ